MELAVKVITNDFFASNSVGYTTMEKAKIASPLLLRKIIRAKVEMMISSFFFPERSNLLFFDVSIKGTCRKGYN